jgi:hypothetical protein
MPLPPAPKQLHPGGLLHARAIAAQPRPGWMQRMAAAGHAVWMRCSTGMPRAAAWAASVVALVAVFTWYLSPHLVVDLAARVWACF